jgi:hypothetical protein
VSPLLRVLLLAYSLGIASATGYLAFRAIAQNVTALVSWRRVQGLVSSDASEDGWIWGKNSAAVRVYLSADLEAMRNAESTLRDPNFRQYAPEAEALFRVVSYTTDLGIPNGNNTIPLFVDPANDQRIKTAGFLQMWVFPAVTLAFTILFLAAGLLVTRVGAGAQPLRPGETPSRWMFTPPPPPLDGGLTLRYPTSYWRNALIWSLLGVAMFGMALHPEGGYSRIQILSGAILGLSFAVAVWISAWRDATLSLTADDHGVRMITITGWRDVPWDQVKRFERQSTYTTYYSGRGMWELPSPGSIIETFAMTDANGRTLLHFGLDLEPEEAKKDLFRLCKAKTGVSVTYRDIPIKY